AAGSFAEQMQCQIAGADSKPSDGDKRNGISARGVRTRALESTHLRIGAAQRNREVRDRVAAWVQHLACHSALDYKHQVAGDNIAVAGQSNASLARAQMAAAVKSLQSVGAERQSIKAEAAIVGAVDLPELRPIDLDGGAGDRRNSVHVQDL